MQSLICTTNVLLRSTKTTTIRSISLIANNFARLHCNSQLYNSHSHVLSKEYHSSTPNNHIIGAVFGCLACTWSHYKMSDLGYMGNSTSYQYINMPGKNGENKIIKYPRVPIWKYFVAGIFFPISIPYYIFKPVVIQLIGYSVYSYYQNKFMNLFNGNRNGSNSYSNQYQYRKNQTYSDPYADSTYGSNENQWNQWTWTPEHGWTESGTNGRNQSEEQEYVYRNTKKNTNSDEYKDYYADAQQFWEEFRKQYEQFYNQTGQQYTYNNSRNSSYSNDYNGYNNSNYNSYNSYNQNTANSSSGMTRIQAYKVLGLDYGASSKDINQAYKKMLMKYHPDHGGSTEMAAKINEARDVLLKH